VVCTLGHPVIPVTQEILNAFETGKPPACEECKKNNEVRETAGKRLQAIGVLRPNVLLYNETNVHANDVVDLVAQDCRSKPDLLLVMGTSLQIDSVKQIVYNIVAEIHKIKNNYGSVLVYYVGKDTVSNKLTDMVFFEGQFKGDCDEFVTFIEERLVLAMAKKGSATEIVQKSSEKGIKKFLSFILLILLSLLTHFHFSFFLTKIISPAKEEADKD
jgi:NAD-dependent SIR2 family protein deacetylase